MSRAAGVPIWVGVDGTFKLQRVRIEDRSDGGFDEAWLQQLIHDHPACLPVNQIEPGFGRLVSVCMEFPTRHGPVDNLLMTSDGDVVIVEAKLWRNPQARREVVAQALDYAACIFEMDYSELENAALRGSFGQQPKPQRLYDHFSEADVSEEPEFIDAVNRNLKRGRILILIVGDGIRTEAERLSENLQSHAGFHFTLALVELAVFKGAEDQGLLVQPSTLAKTTMIERGVVQVDDQRTIVIPATPIAGKSGERKPENITAEQFYEAMAAFDRNLPDQIRAFLNRLEEIGVYPEFKRSLNIKWDPPSGNAVNLGYITRAGQVWTDASGWFAPKELSRVYVEDLAEILEGQVEKVKLGNWHVRIKDKAPRVEAVMGRFDGWVGAIERFVSALKEHFSGQVE